MYLEIISPEATLYQGEVSIVTVPGVRGEFQMLQNHAPIVSLLQKGTVRLKGENGIAEDFETRFRKGPDGAYLLDIQSGTVEMQDNRIIVLAD